MFDLNKEKSLSLAILGGFCPACSHSEIRYIEYEYNKRFGFYCLSCRWNERYTIRDLKSASTQWYRLSKQFDT